MKGGYGGKKAFRLPTAPFIVERLLPADGWARNDSSKGNRGGSSRTSSGGAKKAGTAVNTFSRNAEVEERNPPVV